MDMKPKMEEEEEEEVFEEEEELDDKDDIRDFDEPGDLDPGDLDQPMLGEEPLIAVAGKRFVLCCQICLKRVLLHQQVLRAQFFWTVAQSSWQLGCLASEQLGCGPSENSFFCRQVDRLAALHGHCGGRFGCL